MEFQDVVRRRRMVRRFTGEPVPPEAVDRMLRNAVRAPNAGFTQGWAFVVLDRPDDVARFWSATSPGAVAGVGAADEAGAEAVAGARENRWLAGMRTAPVIVVVLTSREAYLRRYAEDDKARAAAQAAGEGESPWDVPYWHVDAGMASLLMLQTAVDEGLGACFFGVPPGQVEALRAELGVPDELLVTGVVAVGHEAVDTARGVEGGRAASGSPTRRARRPLEDVVHRGGW
ncbi:nitroreductase family protein [Oerskovia sp. Sa1BUA8]|uniref:Nitroreductase family protein n=1 Tax=Oerskovia douganii TaxID=2762210 RepID=A0A9D5YX31_9CELL|nr:nitroreductase family protein [Oerskovia douganii]MBE7699173.1 nitroreductase family protein [Oerskovia douganii]